MAWNANKNITFISQRFKPGVRILSKTKQHENFISRIGLLCVSLSLLSSCTKIGEPELTNCQNCRFLFTENAELVIPGYHFISGNYRLFRAETKKNIVTQKTFIKAPMRGNSFTLTKADIIAGKVEVLDICPECNLIGMKPVDGYVTGENRTPTLRADQARWFIEAEIIREPIGGNNFSFRDTVYIRQYFNADFVIN